MDPSPSSAPLIAVDVGNQRLKLGSFAAGCGDDVPRPQRTLTLDGGGELDGLAAWFEEGGLSDAVWSIGSVNRSSATRLIDWLRDRLPEGRIVMLAADDLPLEVAVARPDMVGVDRLLDAVAANRLRRADRPAVVVDVGTAITVDLVSADGAFRGGAILPGIAMSARAMHEFTDLLPLLEPEELFVPPPAVGAATEAAMRSGLFWGAVGSVRELVDRLGREAGGPAQVFLTGGAGPAVAELLGRDAMHVPHLTLTGIALSMRA